MKTTRGLYAGMVALGITVIFAACAAELGSQQGADPATRIGENDLGGVVTSANGMGRNVPIATGNLNDSLLALVDGRIVNLRVPYPIGFFTKWVEGRIDDPNAGWKGRSLWTTYSTRTMFHLEGGTENRPKVVRFQLRPNPLAR